MSEISPQIFQTIHKKDLLEFSRDSQFDYDRIVEFLELDRNAVSKIAGVSKNSVRLAPDRIPKQVKERLDEIANICLLVAEYFNGDRLKTALWFKTSNPLLGDISPRDMIRFGRYKKLMKFILQALRREGIFSEEAEKTKSAQES